MSNNQETQNSISPLRSVKIKRIATDPKFGTQGIVYLGPREIEFCSSLECYYNNGKNTPFYDCIPEGRYRVEFSYSPKFQRMLYMVMGVVKRSGIRIHPANFAAYKPLYPTGLCELEGCIAFGDDFAQHSLPSAMLTNSRKTTDEFAALMGPEPFWLVIENKF